MLKRLLLLGAGTLVLLLAAALAAPVFIDWRAYRGAVAAHLSERLGREVAIAGELDFRLLPRPALSAGQIRVASLPGAESDWLLRIESVNLEAALAPLLWGDVELRRAILAGPELALERLPDGRRSWALGAGESESEDASEAARRGWLTRLRGFDIREMHISAGRVIWHDHRMARPDTAEAGAAGPDTAGPDTAETRSAGAVAAQRQAGGPVILDRIAAEIAAGRPHRLDASFRTGGIPFSLAVEAGRAGEGAAVPVWAELRRADRPPRRAARAEIRGLAVLGTAPRLGGKLWVDLPEPEPLWRGLGLADHLPAAARAPLSAMGRLEAGAGALTLPELTVTLGAGETGTREMTADSGSGLRATGQMRLTPGAPPRLVGRLAAGRIDLDALAARRASQGPAPQFAKRPAPPAPFRLPRALALELDLAADAVIWRGGALRDLRIETTLAEGVLTFMRLDSELPGAGRLRLHGRLTPRAGRPRAEMTGRLAAANPADLLEWLDVPGTAALRAAAATDFRLAGRFAGTPRAGRLTGARLDLAGLRLEGDLAYDRDGPRPELQVALAGESLDWRRWGAGLAAMARPAGHAAAAEPGDPTPATSPDMPESVTARNGPPRPLAKPRPGWGGASPAPWAALDAALRAWPGADLRLALALDRLRWDGPELAELGLALARHDGALHLEQLRIGDLAGLALAAEGSIARLAPLALEEIAVTFRSPDAAAAAAALGLAVPLPAGALGPVRGRGRIAGDADRAEISGQVSLAGGRWHLGGEISGLARPAPGFDLKARLRHPEAADLAGQLLPGYAPAGAPLGAVDLFARTAGTPRQFALSEIAGEMGGVSLTGEARLDRTGKRPALDLALRASALDLARWRPRHRLRGWPPPLTARLALNSTALELGPLTLADPALIARLADGTLHLDEGDGELAGGRVAARGRLRPGAPGNPPKLAGAVTLSGVEIAALPGVGEGERARTEATELAAEPAAGPAPSPVPAGAPRARLRSGRLSAHFEGRARGRDATALAASLAGSGRLTLAPARLEGLDLGALSRAVAPLARARPSTDPPSAPADPATILAGGETRLARLQARLQAGDGALRLVDLAGQKAAAGSARPGARPGARTGARLTGAGRLDLTSRRWDLTGRAWPTPQGEITPPPVRVTAAGPLARPEFAFDGAELAGWLAARRDNLVARARRAARLASFDRAIADWRRARRAQLRDAVPAGPGADLPGPALRPAPEPGFRPPAPQPPLGPRAQGPAARPAPGRPQRVLHDRPRPLARPKTPEMAEIPEKPETPENVVEDILKRLE